jgi:chemotaxis methyl-accepting protein methylase
MPQIGIVEARSIINAIYQKYDYDFSLYALTAFRYALDKSILLHHVKYPELLASRILEDVEFFDEFLFEITEISDELFRDPETWNLLKHVIFPEYFETFREPKIWFPGACNGQDLFSLLILLQFEFPGKTFSINVSSLSEKNIEKISSGQIFPKILELGLENFEYLYYPSQQKTRL